MYHALVCTAILLIFHISRSLHLSSKSVILTPTSKAHHSVNVSLQGVIITNNEWIINNTPNSQSFLLIDLDKTSAFKPHNESIIIIEINGYSITSDNIDFITTFNVKNQYITTKISLDNAANNQISPICDNNANMLIAEVSTLQTHNISYSDMTPLQFNNGYINSFPLQFTIRNIANNTLLSYESSSWTNFSQFCGFQSFESNSGLKIYLTAYDIHQQFAITSINITYTVSNSSESPSTSIFMNDGTNKTDNVSNGSWFDWMHESFFKYIVLLLAALACLCLNCIIFLLLKQNCRKRRHRNTSNKHNPNIQPVPSNTASNYELPRNIPISPSAKSYSFKVENAASTSPSATGSVYAKGQQNNNTVTNGDLKKEVNKQGVSNTFSGNLTSNDKQRSAVSDRSETLHIMKSEFNIFKTTDFPDDSMEHVHSQLSINKKYLFNAQTERSREISYMTDNSLMLLEMNLNEEINKMSRNMSNELGSELSMKSTPNYNENECDMIIKSPFN